jgi:putative transposase
MLVARKYLLALTPEQEAYAERIAGACRAAWNVGLEQRREWWRRGRLIGYVEQARQMTEAKRENPWFAEAPHQCLQQALRDLDKACRVHGMFKLHWRSKSKTAPFFRFSNPQSLRVRRINRRWGMVQLTNFGWVKFRWTRPLGGDIRYATVKRDRGRWHVSICVEDNVADVSPNGKPPIGIDRGVRVALATSEGDLHDRTFLPATEARRERKLKQQLSRQARSSARRTATRSALTALSGRVHRRRRDFTDQVGTRLVRQYGLIALERIKVENLSKSAKGTIERPGRNVRQKSGLNRAIMSKGWGGFAARVQEMSRRHGATVIKVNPAYTSQTCYVCKHIARESRESQAVFRCVACGHQDNADVNAAKNIRERGIELASAAGLAVTGRGDLGISRSTKRQPPALDVRPASTQEPACQSHAAEAKFRLSPI